MPDQLTAARQAVSKLITEAHQLPLDLSLAFEPERVLRRCDAIIAEAQRIKRAVEGAQKEFRE